MPTIYSHLNDKDLLFVQNLAGYPLDKIAWRDWYTDLADCKNSVILASDIEINTHFELSKKLLDQNNFFVVVNLGESNDTSENLKGAYRDLPKLRNFPTINGASVRNSDQFGIDTFLFKIFDLNNVLRSNWIASKYSTQRPFKFLFLNGRHRDHRSRLWHMLERHGLLSQSLTSYLGYHCHVSCEIFPSLLPVEYESKHINLYRYCPNFIQNNRNLFDFKQGLWQSQWLDGQIDPINRFTDTYFSLVTETEVDVDRCFFITEKTFKPLLAGHPFIILGQPGLYDYIKGLGFMTFSSIIDESFDHEQSTEKRISMIVSEVLRLCSGDLAVFAERCQSICDHNRQHYQTLVFQHFFYLNHEFEKWIIAVLAQAESYISD